MHRVSYPSVLEDLGGANQIHVVGLGGTGLRGIVPLLLARGAKVTGSDKDDSPVLKQFRSDGVECWVGHSDRNVSPGTDLVLISAAVTRDNPEVRAAEENEIRILKYAQCLGYLMREKEGIAVAGTHGKTTTSAMVCFVLTYAGLEPSFVIGGEHPDLGGGSRSGEGPHFVAEACEFDRSFLNLTPRATAITNIEEDHLDYFESLDDIQRAFAEFVDLLPADGFLVYNQDDPNSQFLRETSAVHSESFGLEPNRSDWWAEDIVLTAEGISYTLKGPGVGGQERRSIDVQLAVPGLHNIRNSMACAALCSWAGVPLENIAEGLARFRSVRRRFDMLLEEPYAVVDDYAHHPTEVAVVIRTARQVFPCRKIVCVFQPHQYSRLRRMMDGFAVALGAADDVVVTKVYRARDSEEDVRSVHASALAEELRSRGTACRYATTFPEALELLDNSLQPGQVVLFMGAGDVTDLAKRFVEKCATETSIGCRRLFSA